MKLVAVAYVDSFKIYYIKRNKEKKTKESNETRLNISAFGRHKIGSILQYIVTTAQYSSAFLYGVIKESRHIIVDNTAEVLRNLSIRWRFDLSCDLTIYTTQSQTK